jgi:hypothetical protein
LGSTLFLLEVDKIPAFDVQVPRSRDSTRAKKENGTKRREEGGDLYNTQNTHGRPIDLLRKRRFDISIYASLSVRLG